MLNERQGQISFFSVRTNVTRRGLNWFKALFQADDKNCLHHKSDIIGSSISSICFGFNYLNQQKFVFWLRKEISTQNWFVERWIQLKWNSDQWSICTRRTFGLSLFYRNIEFESDGKSFFEPFGQTSMFWEILKLCWTLKSSTMEKKINPFLLATGKGETCSSIFC